MRCVTFWTIFIILTVFCISLAVPVKGQADSLPGLLQQWEKRIENNSPSKSAGKSSEDEIATSNAKLLEKQGDLLLLQEKHRMQLLLAIVVSTPILLVLALFFLKKTPDCTGESLVSAVGLVLVVEGTMFIAVSAITTEQLTAPIGILGAIAGYLFGAAKRRVMDKSKNPQKT
jgi:hypothetical protein